MTRQRIIAFVLIFTLAIVFLPTRMVQAAGTDEIKNYTIDILPQDDGSLVDTYAINWCVISNAAGPLTWITIGMPNEQYQIVSFSGDVTSAEPDNNGFDYKMRIDLTREVNAGDCVNITVQVHQYGLAYLDKNTKEVSFQFIPGWFSDVPVDHLQLTWHLPTDTTLLKTFDPKPNTQNETQATWESALQPGDKFTLNVSYDQVAFPNLNPDKPVWPLSTNAGTSETGQTTSGSTTNENTGAPVSTVSPVTDFFLPIALTPCVCVIVIIIFIVLIAVFSALGSAGRSYRGGGFFGGYPGGGGWLGGGGGGSILGGGGGPSIPSRSGGGSGLFGGRGSSCACVSSGCACACAGGGRAGCSRKGFDVSGLFKDRKEKEIR